MPTGKATAIPAMFMAMGLIYHEQRTGESLVVQAIAIGQAATSLAIPLGTVAMVIVLFDARSFGGRALSGWGRAFVLFGAAVLLGIAAVTVLKITPVVSELLGLQAGVGS